MSERYRVLAGLPPYGPLAEPFSATGQGLHREGFVVEFKDALGCSWVGNFQRGMTGFDTVVASQTTGRVTVLAGGQAYVVEPATRRCERMFGGGIEHVFVFKDCLVFGNGLWFEARRDESLLWRSRRVSWDGMRDVCVDGARLVGQAFYPDGASTSFSVELDTGEVIGGSYPPELQ